MPSENCGQTVKGDTAGGVFSNDFVFSSDMQEAQDKNFCKYYVMHFFCTRGCAEFNIDDKKYVIQSGQAFVRPGGKPLDNINTSSDFTVTALHISERYMLLNMPRESYNTIGMLSLLMNPLLTMTEREMQLCLTVVSAIHERFSAPRHKFYQNVLRLAVKTLIYDLYDVHSRQKNRQDVSDAQSMRLFASYIHLLERGDFMSERSVNYYASQLFITPKYLSEVSSRASGHPASYWIDYYTTQEISHQLANPNTTLMEISDAMNFTSPSHFTRYVKQHLNMTPKKFRQTLSGI
jgi:AraC family transcriptional activator of pobA